MKSIFLASLSAFILIIGAASCGGGGGGSEEDVSSDMETAESNFSLASLATIKIMPLGDSITEAEDGRASYRYWLWQTLLAAGYSVDFVGGRFGVHRGTARFSDFDQDHQGHWDWEADRILANADSYASTHRPDVVLLHAGTNDIRRSQSVDSTLNEITQIIEIFRIHNPNVIFLVAQLIPTSKNNDKINFFNGSLPALVLAMDNEESRVFLIDQNSGFSLNSDTYDGVHPDESGERKMADRWFDVLRLILP